MGSELLTEPRPSTPTMPVAPRRAPADATSIAAARNSAPIGVMLLISSLEHGGAERQVVELARRIDRMRFTPVICSLSKHVPLAERLPDPEHDLVIVEKHGRFDASTIGRVARVMRERQIRVVHCFLFDAEMVGRCAARLARRPRLTGGPVVIASERNTDYTRPWYQWVSLWLTRNWFDLMIANSEAGKRFNIRKVGIAEPRIRVVRNGVNVDYFKPTAAAELRKELGIPPDAPVVGMVASFKKQKRHGDFFAAAQRVLRRFPQARFVCFGEPLRDNQQGAGDYHEQMRRLVDDRGLAERLVFAGARGDMPAAYSLCDVTVLTSEREGTPNVVLESMACQTPVVATDIADNASVAPDGRVGYIAPLGHVEAISERIVRLLNDSALRARLGAAAREWVVREFSTDALARRTEAVYLEALARRGNRGRRG